MVLLPVHPIKKGADRPPFYRLVAPFLVFPARYIGPFGSGFMGNRNLEASLRASVTPTFEVSRILKDLDADRKEPFGPKRGWRWKDKARNAPRLEFKPGRSPRPVASQTPRSASYEARKM